MAVPAFTHVVASTFASLVVTGSRLEAVRYKQNFDEYIRRKGYAIRTLVAFSGTVPDDKLPEVTYTEETMNDGVRENPVHEYSNDIAGATGHTMPVAPMRRSRHLRRVSVLRTGTHPGCGGVMSDDAGDSLDDDIAKDAEEGTTEGTGGGTMNGMSGEGPFDGPADEQDSRFYGDQPAGSDAGANRQIYSSG